MSFTVPPHLTEISPKCFYGCRDLSVFQIPENAELKPIRPESFYATNIERFTIPSSVVDLQDEWCSCTKLLTQVDVSPNNPRYKKYDEIFIIGKSLIESDICFLFTKCQNRQNSKFYQAYWRFIV